MTLLNARDFAERSPLNPLHGNAPLTQFGPRVFVAHYGDLDEQAQLRQAGLIDLINLPRVGFRGAQAAQYLEAKGYTLPGKPNHAVLQPSGEWIARLSQAEYFLLGSLKDAGDRITREEAAWSDNQTGCYLLPRQDSHAWLALSGSHCSEVMAKVCGVDLRNQAFAPGSVAQTSVARINCVIINASQDSSLLHILCDRASAHYLWGALLDALLEFNGKPVGIEALLRRG